MVAVARPFSRRILTVAGVSVTLLVVAVAYGVARGDSAQGAGTAASTATASVTPQPAPTRTRPPDAPTTSPLRPLPVTRDPQLYAAAVAAVLFGMDQRTYAGADYADLLAAARSPRAEELIPDLTDEAFMAALSERIPDEYMWQRMRDSGQYATFEVSRVWEPDYVAAKRASGELPNGVYGLNVTGTQTISYLDENGDPAQRDRAQSVSLLLVCAPVQPSCALIAVSTGVVE